MRAFAAAVAAIIAIASPAGGAMAQAASASAAEPSSENLALAREIITNGYPPEIRHEMYASVMANMGAQMRQALGTSSQDAGVRAIVDRSFTAMQQDMLSVIDRHTPAIFDSFARAYARGFSTADLVAIRDFSRTAAGRDFISRSSQLLGDPDVAAANQAMMRDAMASAMPASEKLKAELLEYFKQHPAAANQTGKAKP